jgi:hypothetical protein
MTLLFIFCIDFLFNENSMFCCLPENFTNYHTELLDSNSKSLTQSDVDQLKTILDKINVNDLQVIQK